MKKKTLTRVLLEVSVHLRHLYQDKGIREMELLKSHGTYVRKPVTDKTQKNWPQDKRLILCQIRILWDQYVAFTIKRLIVRAGVRKDVLDKTYAVLTINFYIPGKKIHCKKDDLKKRRKFSCKFTKMLTDNFLE